jgi:peptidoglycan/xylan/chitin deacetylase (PgdA/CDA1 family)
MAGPPHLARRTLIAVAALAMTVTAGAAAVTLAPTPSSAAACNGYVALTFDDGPNPATTNSLLNALRSAGARATMFNTGQNAQNNGALVRAQRDAGMWVENHSWSHPNMTQLSQSQMASEISRTQQVIQQLTGTTPRLFRPPYGATNATLRAVQAQYGLTEVIWDVDSQDWNGASTAAIVQAAGRLQAGGVILMHDNYQTTIQAIPQIVANLSSRGLCPGMISPTTGRAVAPDGTTPTTPPPTTPPPTTPPPTTPPPTTPPPTTPPPTTPPPAAGGCRVAYGVNAWNSGLTADITITNTGSSTINGWSLSFALPSGQTIVGGWNASYSPTSGQVTARNASYNGTINPGASVGIGFQANHTGNTAKPSSFTLNGAACALA